jgi:hypothetical protein
MTLSRPEFLKKNAEFSRNVITERAEVIRYVDIRFTKSQVKEMIRVRDIMEKAYLEKHSKCPTFDFLKESINEAFVFSLTLINTIVGDIENPDDVNPEFEGAKRTDERLAAKRREIEKKEEQESLKQYYENYLHYELSVPTYSTKDQRHGTWSEPQSVIEVIIHKNAKGEHSADWLKRLAMGLFKDAIGDGEIQLVGDSESADTLRLKHKEEYIMDLGPVYIISLDEFNPDAM